MDKKSYVKALAFAAKNGNEKCFEELYGLFYDKIYALCLTTLKNADDAQDALQQTFIIVWQNFNKLEDPSAFSTWIQRIAVNQCYSLLRKKKPDISIDDTEDGAFFEMEDKDIELPEQYAERNDLSARLKLIINELSDVQRQTIMLYYYNGLSVEEIAEVMDCSEGTVKSRLFLARKALKTEIEEQERKRGEKFYGVAMLPFADIFIQQVKSSLISKTSASGILKTVMSTSGGIVPPTPVSVTPAYQMPKTPNVQNVSNIPANTGVANTVGGAGKAAGTVVKTGMTLGKKVVAIVVASSIALGGVIGGTFLIRGISKKSPEYSDTYSTQNETVSASDLKDTTLSEREEESLCEFFEYYLWGFRGTFDSSNPDLYGEDSAYDDYKPTLISGIIGHPHGVNYDIYPVIAPRDLTDDETFDNSESYEKAEELGIDDFEGEWLIEYDKEGVYWVAENIFNLNKNTVDSMISECLNDEDDYSWNNIYEGKGEDGRDKYYIVAGGIGGPGFAIDITWVKTDGKKYYILYDEYCDDVSIFSYDSHNSNTMGSGTHYAVVELKSIDGKEYWSIYKDTKDIPEYIFTAESPEVFEQISGTFKFDAAMDETEINVKDDGSFSGICKESYYEYEDDDYAISYFQFTGKFSTPKKIDKYTYTVEIESIEYKHIENYNTDIPTKYNPDGRLDGFEEGKTFKIYVEGTPVKKLSEGFVDTIKYNVDLTTETGLKFPCLYNIENDSGFYREY